MKIVILAGVGRTGTLVALDSLMQQLHDESQVSIFNTVYDMRHQRNFLVQSLVSVQSVVCCCSMEVTYRNKCQNFNFSFRDISETIHLFVSCFTRLCSVWKHRDRIERSQHYRRTAQATIK